MAIENKLNARLQHAVVGEGSTTTSSKPKKGEIIFNNTLDNFRVGTDGNTPYSSLSDFLPTSSNPVDAGAGTTGNIMISDGDNTTSASTYHVDQTTLIFYDSNNNQYSFDFLINNP